MTSPARRTRTGWHPAWWGLLGIAIVFVLLLIGSIITALGLSTFAPLPLIAAVSALPFAAIALVLYVFLILRTLARRVPDNVVRPTAVKETLLGFVGGGAFILVTFGIVLALGGLQITGGPTPGFGLNAVLSIFTMVVLSSVVEEVLLRGVLMTALTQWLGPWVGLILSSVVFGFLHAANPAATTWSCIAIALEAGLMLGAIYLLTGSLWAAIGVHAGWNAVQALLGIPVSGTETSGLLTVEATGPELLTGGDFGLEASVIPVLLGVLISAVALSLWHAKGSSRPASQPLPQYPMTGLPNDAEKHGATDHK